MPMSNRSCTRALVVLTGGIVFLPAPFLAPVHGQTPEVVYLTGTARDFRRAHSDFGVTPSGGLGHYASMVSPSLGEDRTPVHAGGGFKVGNQWYDLGGDPIAPHLFADPSLVRLGSEPITAIDTVIDMWDPNLGPYDPMTATAPDLSVGAPMPTITLPSGMPAAVGTVYERDTVTYTDRDVHTNRFETRRDTILTIQGHCRIWVEGEFRTGQRTQILLAPGAELELWAGGGVSINQGSEINVNTGDPSRVTIFNYGTDPVVIAQNNSVYANVYSPNAHMELHQNDHFYGGFAGAGLQLDRYGQAHLTDLAWHDACGVEIVDTGGTASLASTGGITSVDTFATWYHDTVGTNMSISHDLRMVRDADGIYEYLDDEFHPLDDRLFGNEGESHNNYFTFEVEAPFTYRQCSEQFLSFSGCDDAWIYVDDMLVIDLGGVQGSVPETDQHIDMDRLGLTDGDEHTLRIFYAQRNPDGSVFRLRTNVELRASDRMFTMFAPFD